MLSSGAMAGFAADVDGLVLGVVAVGAEVVILVNISAVALSTATVPIVIDTGPMQWARMRDIFIGIFIDVVPPLTALCLWPGVPGDTQCLKSSPGQRQEQLLKGIDPENIGDFKGLKLAIGIVGTDPVVTVLARKFTGNALISKGDVIEVTKDCVGRGFLHCQIMVRVCPKCGFGLVAIGANG